MKKRLKRLLAAPFIIVAAIFILFEEWLWDDLQRLAATASRLPLFRRIEAIITRLPPYLALLMFAAPTLLLIPLKLAAFFFLAHGKPMLGLTTVISAKVVGTALVARIYTLTQTNLLQIGWFAKLHQRFKLFNDRIHESIRSTLLYKGVRRMRANLIEFFGSRHSLWKSRWGAAVKFSRRWRHSRY